MAHKNRLSLVENFWLVVASLLLALATTRVAVAQNPVPIVNQPLVPDAVKPGGVAFTLTVNGTGFVSTSLVKWNGSARATTFVSSSQLKANILVSDIAKAGTASVTVVNPGPGGGVSNVVFLPVAIPVSVVFRGTQVTTGPGAEGVVTGDFNGDGKLDLAIADNHSNTVSILLGNGDGTFQAHEDYTVGSTPSSVVVGDFNRDGIPDLAVRNQGPNTVSILLGNGDGTFQPAMNFATGTGWARMVVGDFNGDGKLDLATTNNSDGTVSILLGNGDGTFKNHVDYATGLVPLPIAVADVNRDDKLDLVVGNSSNTYTILLGNGDGTFQSPVTYPTIANPASLVLADFNQDGKIDLAVFSESGGTPGLEISLGNGDGTFQRFADYATGCGQQVDCTAAVADLNRDGKLDLIVRNGPASTISVLLGNGDGTFQNPLSFATGSWPEQVAIGDFNGDGRLDLAVTNLTSNTVSILIEDGTVSPNPPSLNFGTQVVGSQSPVQKVVLTNAGRSTLTINSIAVTGIDASDFGEENDCGFSLQPKAHCTIDASFNPTRVGPRLAAVTVTDNAAGSPQTVPLSGIGVTLGPNATLSTKNLTFAIQLVGTTSAVQPVTLSDYGSETLDITSIVASTDFSEKDHCDSSLRPGASCTINVAFAPTRGEHRTGTLLITDNAANGPQTLNLKGTGTVVELNTTGLSFGVHEAGTSSSQSTTLTNVGSRALSIAGIAIKGTDADEFSQTNTCASSVAAGESCTITVTFKPSEKGADSAAIAISDDGGGSPQTVSLSGSGCVIENHRCKTALTRAMQSALAASQTATAPAPTGSSKIGTRIINFVDVARNDPFLNNGDKRELLVRFWYPASVEDICKPAEYTSPRVWNYFAVLTRLPLPKVSTNACLDAPVANSAHPVVVFTHGYTGTFTDYTFLFEDLASRGYVVASIDHTHEATAVEFPDGRMAKSLVGSHLNNTWRMDESTMSLVMSARLKDISFVVNELERLNATLGNPFTGKLDTSRLSLMGHSLGGEATIAGLQKEPRFRAGVTLDGVLTDTSAVETHQALLILAAGRKHWSKQECKLWTALKGPRQAVNLRGAEHLSLSDAVWLARGAFETGTIGPDKTMAAVRDYVATFLDENLRDRPSDRLLAGSSADYPGAEVTTQAQALCREP